MGKIRIKQIGEKPAVAKAKKEQKREALDVESKPAPSKSPKFPKKTTRSLRWKELKKLAAKESYSPAKAIQLVKKAATAGFDETIELHLRLKNKIKSTSVILPYPTGKKLTILIITSSADSIKKNLKALKIPNTLTIGAAGPEEIDNIKKRGAPNVSQIWASPDIMPKIAKIAKILGPAGLMPNPKRGTIVPIDKIEQKIKSLSSGKIILDQEPKNPIIHTILGKAGMKEKQLQENLEAILSAFDYKNIKRAVICSTMGPGIQIRNA